MRISSGLRLLRILLLATLSPSALWFFAIPADVRAEASSPPPVILISIDTLRADHLSCYGYTKLQTPHIDSLARDGTLFAQINSQVPITLPSHVSLFTSSYPFTNGIRENGQILGPGAVTLATVLAGQGYRTAAFIGGYFLARRFGLAQGFETYDSPFDDRGIDSALDLKRSAAQVLSAAEHWLEGNSKSPFFLFVHLFDLHQPYDAPAKYAYRAPRSEYDQELAYVDDSLGSFLDFLAKRGLGKRAMIVLLSDHGESLGDHGEITHGYFIYQSTLHVPLIIHWPGQPANRDSKLEPGNSPPGSNIESRVTNSSAYLPKVDEPAGLIDVAPTILSCLGIPPPASFCGHSLLGLSQGGQSAPRDLYGESYYAHDKFGWAALRALRRGDYQYIEAPRPELYDLKQDSAELHNLLPGQSALAASYREQLSALLAAYRAAPAEAQSDREIAPGIAENMRSLGYLEITSSHAALEDSGVDPKDRLFEYKRYLLAGHLARIGRAEEAVAEFQAILADDPRNVPARIELARSDIGLRHYFDAVNEIRTVLSLDPDNGQAEQLLGDIGLSTGNYDLAASEFQRLLTREPQNYEAHFGLGLVAAHGGENAEAMKQFHAALAANPHSAEAHYHLGLLWEAQNNMPEAAKEFRKALAISPKYAAARKELGKLSQ